jgi:hypothetical protein
MLGKALPFRLSRLMSLVKPKNKSRAFLIFCYGLFTIASQTLLFREFLTTFQGSNISVGLFFASWFFWIGLAAILTSRSSKITAPLQKNIDLLFFAYIPAFVLELFLIIQARHIASVSSYTLLSIRQMVVLSLLVNAPVSIITGVFFPLACRWIQSSSRFPVSNVYIIEAAGAFLGGIGATIVLMYLYQTRFGSLYLHIGVISSLFMIGLTVKDNMDYIYCDRCRYYLKSSLPLFKSQHTPAPVARVLSILVLISAIFVSFAYIDKFIDTLPSSAQLTPAQTSSAGQPRDVDLPKIRSMIKEKNLSDHPADFYEKK